MKKYILLTLSTAMLALSSCGDDTMDKINKDTHHPTAEIVAVRLSCAPLSAPFPVTTHSIPAPSLSSW